MTLNEARQLNLDVYMFHRESGFPEHVAMAARLQHREVHVFTDHVGTTEVRCVAVGPRPDAGKIARDMKERRKKTVREFIQEQ